MAKTPARRKDKLPPLIPVRHNRWRDDNLASRYLPDLSSVFLNRYLATTIGLQETIIIQQYIEFANDFPSGATRFRVMKEDLTHAFPFLKKDRIRLYEDNLIKLGLLERVEADEWFTYRVVYKGVMEVMDRVSGKES